MTNADRIRNMSNEDLAKFITACGCCARFGIDCGFPTCRSMNGDWCNGIAKGEHKLISDWLTEETK